MIPAVVGVLLLAIVLVLIGLRRPSAGTTIQDRLLEYSTRAEAVSLEELELSQPFSQRVLVPMINGVARFVTRFTPQQTLEQTQHNLELAGRPNNWSPSQFWGIRVVATVLLGGSFALLMIVAQQPFGKILMLAGRCRYDLILHLNNRERG